MIDSIVKYVQAVKISDQETTLYTIIVFFVAFLCGTIISIFNSSNQQVSGPHYFPIQMQSDLAIFSQVSQKLEEVVKESNISRDKILVAGLELPGLINQKAGINQTYFTEDKNLLDE